MDNLILFKILRKEKLSVAYYLSSTIDSELSCHNSKNISLYVIVVNDFELFSDKLINNQQHMCVMHTVLTD